MAERISEQERKAYLRKYHASVASLSSGYQPDSMVFSAQLCEDIADLRIQLQQAEDERNAAVGANALLKEAVVEQAREAVSLFVRWNRGNEKGIKYEAVVMSMMDLRAELEVK